MLNCLYIEEENRFQAEKQQFMEELIYPTLKKLSEGNINECY
jgi:hypothetical protein